LGGGGGIYQGEDRRRPSTCWNWIKLENHCAIKRSNAQCPNANILSIFPQSLCWTNMGIKEQSIANIAVHAPWMQQEQLKFARREHLLCENRISCAEPRTYAHELECWWSEGFDGVLLNPPMLINMVINMCKINPHINCFVQ
jgi:hypothetical protein